MTHRPDATSAELDGAVTAAGLAAEYLGQLGDRPVWRPVAGPDRDWLTSQLLPETGRDAAELLADIRAHLLPYPMGNGHPRFFGWVNSAPAPAGVAVEVLASAMDPSCAGGEHGAVLLERTVVRWLAELIGYPAPPGGGLLTSGASMATIIAIAAARQRAGRELGWDVRADGLSGRPPLVLYTSAEGHSCVVKAAELLGLGSRWVRQIAADAGGRLDPGRLAAAVRADRADGAVPFCVVATAGTVTTGAIDPLADLADLAGRYGLWLHVDGAYGALAAVAPRLRPARAGRARADSLALDAHKWLGVPVDCGSLLFRAPQQVRETFSLVPAYLRADSPDGLGWLSEYGIEQTRPFRALRAWATISALGRAGIAALVTTTCERARQLAELIEADPGFELCAPVVTSIVAFRWRPASLAPEPADQTVADQTVADQTRTDQVNEAIPAEVQRQGRAFLTGAALGGRPVLRACLLNPATTGADLAVLLDEIRGAALRLRA